MKLFENAYLKLTAWYVVIIMAISLLFSIWVYNQASNELRFGFNRAIELKQLTVQSANGFSAVIDDRLIDSQQRLLESLVLFNVCVLAVGAGASYFLARRTMRPVEEAMQAQERFTADASHELRTPLAAMKAEIEVGLRDASITKADAVDLLKSNLEEIERMSGLAEGLLALTQSAAPQLKQVAVHKEVQAITKRFASLAAAKHIELKLQLEPTTANADHQALQKIISILLDNAIKYSAPHSEVTVKTYGQETHAYIAVQDHGIGLKATELPHIFERFYRADSSRSHTHIAGHGLGLSIAQKLAHDMGGVITATSTAGKGSTFLLKLAR